MPSLAHLLRASSAHGTVFDARAACAIAGQVCAQLERPHGAVAPSAILVEWDGSVALERAGHAPSSALPYMAPERLAGAAPDARSDVHAVAMVLLELITGRPARRAPGLTFDGDLPVELVELLERSSSPDPARRHSSPREMAAWLALAEEESGGAMSREELAGWLTARFGRPSGPVSRPLSAARRPWRPLRLAAAAGLLALIGAGAAVVARPLVDAREEAAGTAMVVDQAAAGSPMSAPAAMSSSMIVTPASMTPSSAAPDAASKPARSVVPAPATAVVGASGADDASGSDAARKARRRRARAARRASAAAELPPAGAAGATQAQASAPASCPISEAPSNTMAPARDRMAPAAKDAMAPARDRMAPVAKDRMAPAARSSTP